MSPTAKLVLGLLIASIAFLVYRYVIRIWLKLGYYKAQGVHIIEGAYIPVFGNLV